ncbi:MAG TPA: hypothetical protein PKI01_07575 [Bacteroidales bacterium]|nr:hypothetical protein [Bacteroidales bacterium]
MGLSIHYSGSFNPAASLQELIEEVRDIAQVYKWKFYIYETTFPEQNDSQQYNDKVFGICFIPPECEPVSIEFLSNKKMSTVINLKLFGNSENQDYQKYLYQVSVKTQYAGPAVHMVIVKIFRYLSTKYFLNFQMFDEANYWETGDENVLKEMFARYNKLLDMFCDGLECFPAQKDESLESYFTRLIEYINKKRQAE